ncbi:hypothetical protein HKD37_03G006605 [Glycine soja]
MSTSEKSVKQFTIFNPVSFLPQSRMVISKILLFLLPKNPKLELRTLRQSRVCEVLLLIVDGGVRVCEVLLLIVVGRWKCLLFASFGIHEVANRRTNKEVKNSPWWDLFIVYINGPIIEEEWGWHVDIMSYIDFTKVINFLGYKSFKCLWYRDPRKALSRGLKPLNYDSDILQLVEDISSFDVVEVYVDQGVFDKYAKKLNDDKGDEVVVIDEVGAEAVVEGEDEAEGQVEAEVQVDEQGLVEGEDEVAVVGEIEVVVEGVVEDDVEAEEDDDDSNNCSEVSYKLLDPRTFSQSSHPTFDTNQVTPHLVRVVTPDGSEDEGPLKVIFPHFNVLENDDGLVEVIKEFGNNIEYRLCVKHLYGNWKKKYLGEQMKELMWMEARATIAPDWDKAMNQIKCYDVEAWKDLERLNPATWTRSAFKVNTTRDLQVNNMRETFNNVIMKYKDEPIITLLEGIRFYISSRIVKLRTTLMMYEGSIYPKVQQIIGKIKKKHVKHDHIGQTCSCRNWELTGISCTHSIACMWIDAMLPLVMRRALGRPKKARNKRNDKPRNSFKLPRQSKSIVYKKCGKIGHNKGHVNERQVQIGTFQNGRQTTSLTNVVTKKQKNVSCTSGTTCVGIQGGDSTNQTQESQIS